MQIAGNMTTIGKIRNIRVSESIRRIDVKGIGEFYPKEKCPVDWAGSINCQSFLVDLKTTGIIGSPNRNTNDAEKFANTILLDEQGVDIFIYRKVKDQVNPVTGIVETIVEDIVAAIRNCFIERESFDITDGQVAGRDQDFSYLTPVLFD
jgi:hypothetical protein